MFIESFCCGLCKVLCAVYVCIILCIFGGRVYIYTVWSLFNGVCSVYVVFLHVLFGIVVFFYGLWDSVLYVFRGDFRFCRVIPSLLGSPFNVYFGVSG